MEQNTANLDPHSKLEREVGVDGNRYSRIKLNRDRGTVLLKLGNENSLSVRFSNLGVMDGNEHATFMLEAFDGLNGQPVMEPAAFDLTEDIELATTKNLEFPEGIEIDEGVHEMLDGQRIAVANNGIIATEFTGSYELGPDDARFAPEDVSENGTGFIVHHADGQSYHIHHRIGTAHDGELEGEDITVIDIFDPESEERRTIKDYAHSIEARALEGGRFILRHKKAAAGVGSAAIVATGVAVTAVKLGKSKFLRK